MHFLAPIWLLGLLPWGAVTAWLLWGKRRKEGVPFLVLWKGTEVERRAKRSVQLPPLALGAMIAAMLLGVLAAGRPVMKGAGGELVTVLVDRGVTMSATSEGRPRFAAAAGRLAETLAASRVEVVDVLSGERRSFEGAKWIEWVAALPRTAVDTAGLVGPAVRDALSRDEGRVVLLSDQRVGFEDARLTQVAPEKPIQNVAITVLAARERPTAQVMVRVRNDSGLVGAELHVSSAGQEVTRRIELPAMGKEGKFFIDLPRFGEVIEARLDVKDDLEADNAAWLVREKRAGRVEIRSPVSEALRRMAEVYTKAKPPADGSEVIGVVSRREDLRNGDVGAIVESPALQDKPAGDVRVVEHPLTAVVDWRAVAKDGVATANAPEGWKPLVMMGDRALVAVREGPARQVWVGFDGAQWPRSADFVVFWTNVFDWLGGDGREFASERVAIQGEEWVRQGELPAGVQGNAWPGVFRRSDGTLRAVNVGEVTSDVREMTRPNPDLLSGLEHARDRGLGRWLGLAAILMVALATLLWRNEGYRRS